MNDDLVQRGARLIGVNVEQFRSLLQNCADVAEISFEQALWLFILANEPAKGKKS